MFVGEKVKRFKISFGELMNTMVTIVNNPVLYAWNLILIILTSPYT